MRMPGLRDAERRGSLINGVGGKLTPMCTKMKPDSYLTLYAKTNLKAVKDLGGRPDPPELLLENQGEKLSTIRFGKDCLDLAQKKHRQR